MPFDPAELRQVGRTKLKTNLLGLGTVQIGGWPRRLPEEEAHKVLESAWDAGIRTFDTAPMYGMGMSEERLGRFLAYKPKESYVISTKVGRIVEDDPNNSQPTGDDEFWKGAPPRLYHFDFSYDGVMRSVEQSLERTGLSKFDMLLIHDADEHVDEALDGCYKALDKLRSEGTVTAIGAGMNQNPALARMASEVDMDVFLLAGRYTLLDHAALTELFPICEKKGTTILIGGVYNSGVLNTPVKGASFDYVPLDENWRANVLDHGVRAPADHETGDYWLQRAQAIDAVCQRHNVPLSTAAIQFSAAHPIVSSIPVGAGRPERFQQNMDALTADIPDDLWAELKHEGLMAEDAPVPTSSTIDA